MNVCAATSVRQGFTYSLSNSVRCSNQINGHLSSTVNVRSFIVQLNNVVPPLQPQPQNQEASARMTPLLSGRYCLPCYTGARYFFGLPRFRTGILTVYLTVAEVVVCRPLFYSLVPAHFRFLVDRQS